TYRESSSPMKSFATTRRVTSKTKDPRRAAGTRVSRRALGFVRCGASDLSLRLERDRGPESPASFIQSYFAARKFGHIIFAQPVECRALFAHDNLPSGVFGSACRRLTAWAHNNKGGVCGAEQRARRDFGFQ